MHRMTDREYWIRRLERDGDRIAAEKRARANDIENIDICTLIDRARNGDNAAIAELKLRGQNQSRNGF